MSRCCWPDPPSLTAAGPVCIKWPLAWEPNPNRSPNARASGRGSASPLDPQETTCAPFKLCPLQTCASGGRLTKSLGALG